MSDSPYNYRMSPGGLDFLKAVPTTWDETRVLDGFPGEFVVIARRSGSDWFIGGMNGDTARSVSIPLRFLGAGEFTARSWSDAEEVADYPERVWEKRASVKAGDVLTVRMAASGGYAAHLSAARK